MGWAALGPFSSEARAQIARGALEGHGIEVRLEQDEGGWLVHVDPDDVEAAREVLRAPEPATDHSQRRLAVELVLGIVVAIGLYAAVVSWLAG